MHCSELSGIIGALACLFSICSKFNITDVDVDFRYNGLETLKGANKYDESATTVIGHFNLISTVYKLIYICPFNITFSYVRGYRDKISTALTIFEELNIVVDARARATL